MSGAGTIQILLVDDHPLVRDGLKARLEATPHYRVVGEAGNAETALGLAARLPVDLVLMDINLGGTNGIMLTANFTRDYPAIAVIMLSMHDQAEYVTQAMQAGARGYVRKDAPAEDIVNAIEAVMDGKPYFSSGLSTPVHAATATGVLTEREKCILKSIATGKSNKHIARELGLSVRTVETHRPTSSANSE